MKVGAEFKVVPWGGYLGVPTHALQLHTIGIPQPSLLVSVSADPEELERAAVAYAEAVLESARRFTAASTLQRLEAAP